MLLKYLRQPALWLVACAPLLLNAPLLAQDVSFTQLVLVWELTEPLTTVPLPPLSYGEAHFVNLRHDDDFDIIASGRSQEELTFYTANGLRDEHVMSAKPPYWRRIFRVNENGSLGAWKGGAARGDFNHDGRVDFASLGGKSIARPLNPGLITWANEEVSVTSGGYNGDVAPGDYDNDGTAELVVSGIDPSGTHFTAIFEYDGTIGGWHAVPANLPQLAYSTNSWIDFDGDADLDLFLAGKKESGEFVADVFENQMGSLAPLGLDLPNLIYGAADWGDYDQDGDPDLVYSGGALDPRYKLRARTVLYENESGDLSEAATELPGIMEGDLRWGDADNDGDLDLFLAGSQRVDGPSIAHLYMNENGMLSRSSGLPIPGRAHASIDLADYEHDGDLDVLISGEMEEQPSIYIYRNESNTTNQPPATPSALTSSVAQGVVRLSWQAASDDFTPSQSLTYNLRVGSSQGTIDVVAPVADPQSGRRWIPAPGNSGLGTTHVLRDLPSGTYYWSVQTLDTSFKGSPFAPDGTFVIP